MKKMLMGATALSLFLAGCGQGEEKKEDKAKTVEVKTEEKEKFVSESDVKKEAQKFFDETYNHTVELNKMQTLDFEGPIADQFRSIGADFIKSADNFKKYLKSVKEPIKYTAPSETIINSVNDLGEALVDTGNLFEEKLSGSITDEEFKKRNKELSDRLGKLGDKKVTDAEEFFEKQGVDLSKIQNLESADNSQGDESSSESQSNESSASDSTEERQTSITKTVEPNKIISAGPAELTISKVELGEAEVTEDNSYDFPDLKVGDKAQLVFVYMTLKNTVDQNTDYYADQAIITTDTGEQLEPMMVMEDDGITAEMKGDIESSGRVIYQLKNSAVKDLNSITFIAPAYNDPETMDEITPEQKIEIPVK